MLLLHPCIILSFQLYNRQIYTSQPANDQTNLFKSAYQSFIVQINTCTSTHVAEYCHRLCQFLFLLCLLFLFLACTGARSVNLWIDQCNGLKGELVMLPLVSVVQYLWSWESGIWKCIVSVGSWHCHSVSTFILGPQCVWLVVFGGQRESGTSRIACTAIVELGEHYKQLCLYNTYQ